MSGGRKTRKLAALPLPPDLLQNARLCTTGQRVFAETLVRDPARNQTRAAKAAGAKDPRIQGCRWAKNPKVRRYMDAIVREASRASVAAHPPMVPAPDELVLAPRVRAAAMDVQELLERISEDARVDMADFISVQVPGAIGGDHLAQPNMPHTAVFFDWNKAVRNGKTHLIREITWNKHGYPCVKLVDKQAAERTLAQIRGLLTEPDRDDSNQLSAAITALAALPPETLRQIHRAFLAQGSIDVPARVALPEVAVAGR